jgi:hypothetical protein
MIQKQVIELVKNRIDKRYLDLAIEPAIVLAGKLDYEKASRESRYIVEEVRWLLGLQSTSMTQARQALGVRDTSRLRAVAVMLVSELGDYFYRMAMKQDPYKTRFERIKEVFEDANEDF